MLTQTLLVGSSITIQAAGVFTATGGGAPFTAPPSWSVDFPAFVSITPTGATCVATAIAAGVATVTCTAGLLSQSVQITVNAATTADAIVLTIN